MQGHNFMIISQQKSCSRRPRTISKFHTSVPFPYHQLALALVACPPTQRGYISNYHT
jgi:hypothetical protein